MKSVLLCLSILLVLPLNAQNSKVTSAHKLYVKGSYENAQKTIDKAVLDDENKERSKTWYVRGMVYQAIQAKYNEFPEEQRSPALITAIQSYEKALVLNAGKIDWNNLRVRLKRCNSLAFHEGVESFNNDHLDKAIDLFLSSISGSKQLEFTDSLAMYYLGLSYEKKGEYLLAAKQYEQCADIGYKGAEMYSLIAYTYDQIGAKELADAAIKKGHQAYPNDRTLLFGELNLYVQQGDYSKALLYLNNLIEESPKSALLYYARGAVKESLKESSEDIIADYEKALQLNPNYFEANYNLGAHYFNLGVDVHNQRAEDGIGESEDQKLKEEASTLFDKALFYLEKAHEANPNHAFTIQSLKQIYAHLDMTEKYQEMKNKLGE